MLNKLKKRIKKPLFVLDFNSESSQFNKVSLKFVCR